MSQQPHVNCSHKLSAHVIYDKATAGYRAQIRCPCGLTSRVAKTLHERFADAEAESRTMPLRGPEPPAPKPRRVRVRKPAAKIAASAPVLPPTPAEVNAAWLAYWRSVCASVGHQSRL
jgi:hypothetical protein